MVTVNPIRRALVPVDSGAAQRLCSPNYDEFQSDREIWELLQVQRESVLRVTMPHCNAPRAEEMLPDGSPGALAVGTREMAGLVESASTEVVEDALFLYEIGDPARPGVRQIGLGGMAPTDDIRTEATPDGVIIRNEGIREEKAQGRADLIEATGAIIGTVNLSVDDVENKLLNALLDYAAGRPCDFEATDHDDGSAHRIWLVTAVDEVACLREVLAIEPHAYVADGNHRSAAAAMRGTGEFLTVFFLALFCAALSSLIAMIELGTRVLIDTGITRRTAVRLVGAATVVFGIPSAVSLAVFENQDWVWSLGLMVNGLFIAFAAIQYGVGRFRDEFVSTVSDRFWIRIFYGWVLKYLVPVEFVVMFSWWMYQAVTVYDPDGWWNPIRTYSVGTCLLQWGVALTLMFCLNRRLAAASVRGQNAAL